MREIKFRGKRHYDGKWVYGYPLIVDTNKYKSANIVTLDEAYPDTLAKVTTSVDFNSLGQFTGLHDKNGKEIYEGDIIKFYDKDKYCINPDCDEPHLLGYGPCLIEREEVVVFDDCVFGIDDEFYPIRDLMSFGFRDLEDLKNYENDPYFDANGYDLDDVIGLEVVGNIHDNPELIEKGGEQ